MKMMYTNVKTVVCIFLVSTVIKETMARGGRPAGPGNNVGEHVPQNLMPKPYSYNYEVMDEHGNTHYRREQSDSSGIVTGSYGYMNINGLYRMVDYMADATGFKAKIKTNEPGAKGPGSADVMVQADPVPQGLLAMFERKTTASPSLSIPTTRPPISRPRYPMMKG